MLHVSRREQAKRFLKRIDHPDKNWKFSPSDVRERWFSRLATAAVLVAELGIERAVSRLA